MDKLARYKLDKAFTDGVEVRLDDAPDVAFLIRLPSQYNRAYTQALYGSVEIDFNDGGKVSGGLLKTRFAQEDAFLDHCLLAMDGDKVPVDFAQQYPKALQELMEKAAELAGAIDDKVATSVKKSPASLTGKGDGQAGKSSTPALSAKAS